MTRFHTPEEVVAWAERVAREDIERHRPIHHDADGTPYQIDLNPYTTPGARNDWQRGFDNAPPRPWERTQEYDTMYQRGRAVAHLLKKEME